MRIQYSYLKQYLLTEKELDPHQWILNSEQIQDIFWTGHRELYLSHWHRNISTSLLPNYPFNNCRVLLLSFTWGDQRQVNTISPLPNSLIIKRYMSLGYTWVRKRKRKTQISEAIIIKAYVLSIGSWLKALGLYLFSPGDPDWQRLTEHCQRQWAKGEVLYLQLNAQSRSDSHNLLTMNITMQCSMEDEEPEVFSAKQ